MGALILPLVSACLNRKWRGEAGAPRWVWYSFMTIIGYAVTLDPIFTIGWLLFLLGYALAPWQAMFSTITGAAPGRTDGIWNWMQTLAYKIESPPINWRKFGIVYGAIRASLMLPAVAYFTIYLHSPKPLIGILFLGMGWIYHEMTKVTKHFNLNADMAVPFSEIFMGWAIMTYLLILQ